MSNASRAASAPRSAFVTTLAWTLLVVAGLGTCVALLQNVIVNFVASAEHMRQAGASAPGDVPWLMRQMLLHARPFAAAFLALCLALLAAAAALLGRRNWARIAFMVLFALGAALEAVSVGRTLAHLYADAPALVTDEFGRQYARFDLYFSLLAAATGSALGALFAWLSWKLGSRRVAAEFG